MTTKFNTEDRGYKARSPRTDDLVVGSWRNGLSQRTYYHVWHMEDKRRRGFKMLPQESAFCALVDLLDSYDEIASEFCNEEPRPDIIAGEDD